MNSNFNVKLQVRPDLLEHAPYLVFLNSNIRRVEARMFHKGRKPSAATMNKDTSIEGFRIFIGDDVLGTGETNTARLLLESLLAFEQLVDTGAVSLRGGLEVSFLGETKEFAIGEFTLMSISASQGSSYVEYEVKITLVQNT